MRIQTIVILGGITLFGGADSIWAQCQVGPDWKLRSSTGPPPRLDHAMAFDPTRGVVVMYGGDCCNRPTSLDDYLADTWEWDGVEWTLRAANSWPGRRMSHAMAFDGSGVLMYGGFGVDDLSRRDDTWVWDGLYWRLRTTGVPIHRNWHALEYDSNLSRVVMFGGQISRDYPRTDETWRWNGASWSPLTTDGPSARSSPAMAYDSDRQVTVLFGGSSVPANQETWELSGNAWTQREVNGPPGGSTFAMAYYAAGKQALLFTAVGSPGPQGHTWLWDGTTWTLRSDLGDPCARVGHAMVYDSLREVVVLFGGSGCGVNGMNGETWEYGCSVEESDCNANCINDQCEIDPADPDGDGLVSPDCNGNQVPDACETIANGDIDGNEVTDLLDYRLLVDCLAGPGVVPAPTEASCSDLCLVAFDLDADGDADLGDASAFQTAFGQTGH